MLLLSAGCASPRHEATSLERFEFSQPQMGVPFRIVLYATERSTAESAARAAFARISELNDIMSDYDTDSELNRLSRTAGTDQAVPVSPDLWRVLEQSQALAARSGGAFDITVGPCVSLWRKARREKQLPRPDLLARALAATGWQKLQLDSRSRTAKLLVPEMKLDLGGIAKGYATEEALKTLRQHGITRALVTGGGDMSAGDPPPGKTGWRIEIAPLDATNAPPPRFVSLAHASLATSGDVFQHVEIGGVRYSHIVDPKTGFGLTDHSLVTVIARQGMIADGLAKVVSVLGPERGLKFVEETRDTAACVVRQPGREIESRESSRFQAWLEKTPP